MGSGIRCRASQVVIYDITGTEATLPALRPMSSSVLRV
jgi:hypothetical protein